MYAIGVDIGGMSIKVGLVDENGKILVSNRRKTGRTSEIAIENTAEQIKEILEESKLSEKDIAGIGIGCPGLIDSENGVVDRNSNMKWDKFPLVAVLKKHFDVKIKISNDANVAALGETIFGCAKDYKNAIMLTLGTGVGGGIIIDNKIYEGGFSQGAELGHMVVKVDGVKCGCGRRGCLEAYASATGLIRMTKEEMNKNPLSDMWKFVDGDIEKTDGRTAFECAKKGDVSANKVVNKFVKYLSEGMMNLMNAFRPEAFILGGGVSAQGKYLTEKIERYCEKRFYGYKHAKKPQIVTAILGNDAGIIGAASLVM